MTKVKDEDRQTAYSPESPQPSIDQLAAAIVKASKNQLPLDVALWTVEQVAAYLNRSVASTRERIVCLPDFPRPFRLPSTTKGGHPLYKASEVMAWVERYRDAGRMPKTRKRKAPDKPAPLEIVKKD